jgi:molecular chaperone GrpE
MNVRVFSDKATNASDSEAKEEAVENETAPEQEGEAPASEAETFKEEREVEEEISREMQLEVEVRKLKDQLLRSLAEQDNTRRIAKRDVEAAKNFAVSSFAKSLLDTSDNLTRALAAVPEEEKEKNPVLATLYEGIQMTSVGLIKAFEKNGLIKFGEVGEPFDPNKHEALFEYSNPEQEPGTIGQVMKSGFVLNDRVMRPAEVGVVKKE